VKARFQKAGIGKAGCEGIDVDGRFCLIKVEGADEVNVLPGIWGCWVPSIRMRTAKKQDDRGLETAVEGE
jgi:hypothetical protein